MLAALYLLIPYQAIFTGPVPADADKYTDMNMREKGVITPDTDRNGRTWYLVARWLTHNPVAETALQQLNRDRYCPVQGDGSADAIG